MQNSSTSTYSGLFSETDSFESCSKGEDFLQIREVVHSCVCPEIVHISAFCPLALLVTEWPAGKRRLDKVFSSDESS